MKIVDKFLTDQNFNSLKEELIYNQNVPWLWSDRKVHKGDGTDTLVHMIYRDHKPTSDYFKKVHSYFSLLLDVSSWLRIKMNCTWLDQESKVFGYHTDIGDLSNQQAKTAIYYCTTTNGPTVFEDSKEEVDCIENRLLIFDSTRRHSGQSHTEGPARRLVINFNYF
tara:strand:- start:3361 stop:3858 length:498 start_codon:yes stop_codon:yes gene_type:complete